MKKMINCKISISDNEEINSNISCKNFESLNFDFSLKKSKNYKNFDKNSYKTKKFLLKSSLSPTNYSKNFAKDIIKGSLYKNKKLRIKNLSLYSSNDITSDKFFAKLKKTVFPIYFLQKFSFFLNKNNSSIQIF